MPAYRIMLSRGGQRSAFVIDADSEESAVERVLSTGASVLAVEEVRAQVFEAGHSELRHPEPQPAGLAHAGGWGAGAGGGAAHATASSPVGVAGITRSSGRGRNGGRGGSDWSGFWSFRLMLTPLIIRWTFIIASVCLAAILVIYPIHFFVERSKVGVAEARVVRQIEAALPRIKVLHGEWSAERVKAEQLGLQEGYQAAAKEARAKAAQSKGAYDRALDDAGIAGEDEDEALARAREAYQSALRAAPSLYVLWLNLGTAVLMWIILRLVCEGSIIFFRIHEQVVVMSDRLREGGGG